MLIADVYEYGGDKSDANTQFIAHAREDIPKLLNEVDRRNRNLAEKDAEMERDEYVPHVIKSEDDYLKALDVLHYLMDATPGSPDEEKLELLSILIEVYEKEHYPINTDDEKDAEITRLKTQLNLAVQWLSAMNSAWGPEDNVYDDFGTENPPPTCAVCGSPLQSVRPGKWQCPKCE